MYHVSFDGFSVNLLKFYYHQCRSLRKHTCRLVFPQHFSFTQTSTGVSTDYELEVSIAGITVDEGAARVNCHA